MQSHLPAGDSRAVVFATTADGLRLPVIDVTHPAFAVPDDPASLAARRDAFLAWDRRNRRMPRIVMRLLTRLGTRRSPLLRMILASENEYLDSISTYVIKLGPDHLPVLGTVGEQLHGYDRTGHRSVGTFLATYFDDATGSFRFPPQDGYVIRPDGTPLRWQQHLVPGTRIDRYGSEFGAFLAPEGARYASRSIPPQNLVGTPAAGCNYHDYQVLRDFQVDAGPIAPWFFQPGHGLQYQLESALVPGAPARLNVMWLVDNGYLQRLI